MERGHDALFGVECAEMGGVSLFLCVMWALAWHGNAAFARRFIPLLLVMAPTPT